VFIGKTNNFNTTLLANLTAADRLSVNHASQACDLAMTSLKRMASTKKASQVKPEKPF
jgi:hypothetical protein